MTHPSVQARIRPAKPAYVMAGSGETVTFAALDARSNQGAQLFRARGIGARDHVALCLENNARFLEICWAAQRAGLYYTAISARLTAGEAAYIVGDCGARMLIADAALAPVARDLGGLIPDGVERLAVGGAIAGYGSWEAAIAAMPASPIADEVAGHDMLYSSGTTGRPKGVLVPFQNAPITAITPLLTMLQTLYGMDAETRYLSPAPLYHAAPLRFNMMVTALGGTSWIMEQFDPEAFLRLVETHRITHAQLVPTMFVRLLKLPEEVRRRYRLDSLRCVVHAAAPCPVSVKERMIAWWGPILHEYYGGTEGNGLTALDSQAWLAHRGSVGKAVSGTVHIVGEDGGELLHGQTGLVYFSGGREFTYHNDPAKTADAHDARGWSTLGDVGHLDEDGYLYLTDRKAFMIISGGVNIYPQETENVLIGHPAVADVAVFGVPNEEFGEEVKAVVQLTDFTHAGPEMEAELLGFCRARLSAIKCPRSVDFEEELPRHPTGKLYKRLLRDRYWGNRHSRIA